jgi:arylsulfatase A-like enzyme
LLKQQGELSNTYIVFVSDNGLLMGEHRKRGKQAPYEESAGVPLVIRGPGVEQGTVREHMVVNNDFAPTFAEMGGADVPSFIEGKSFRTLLGATPPPSSDWRTAFLIERLWAPDPLNPSNMPKYAAIRNRDHLYVEYETGEHELYDLNTDPYELRNQHDTADPALVAQLEARLEALRDCAGAECRAAEEGRPAG